jgi:hypothetical protein
MIFRRLPLKRAPDPTLIVPAVTNGVGISSASALVATDLVVESVVAAVNGAVRILESSRTSLQEPIMHLAESAEALAAMAKAISERADPVIQPAVLAAGGELKTAIDQLTAKVDQLGTKTFYSAAGRVYAQELQDS